MRFLESFECGPNSMQARTRFLMLIMYNPTNRKEMLRQKNWQWAFYPMLAEAYSQSENIKQGKTNNNDNDDEVMYQDTYPISLKLIRILLLHAFSHIKNGWVHLEQFLIMSNFSKMERV